MPELADARVVVVGGAGFIGSHVVEELLTRPVASVKVVDNFVRGKRENLAAVAADGRLSVVEATIADAAAVRRALDGADYVFHLAALWLYECLNEPRSAVEINVGGTYNVVEAAHAAGVRKLVYSSSASVYGDARETPMTEEHPFDNRTMYGATKIAGEQFLRAFHEQHRLDYIGLRYMNVYGPRMDDRGAYVSVIVKVLDRIDDGLPPLVYGDGTQTYDFVHVRDVARANVLALESDATDAFFNVGTGRGTTIAELVRELLAVTGSDVEPEHVPAAQTFVSHRVGSTRAAERELGFRAEVGLREGLESTVDWWRRERRDRAAAARAT